MDPWAKIAMDHLKEFRPKISRELQASGMLTKACENLATLAVEEMRALRRAGTDPSVARSFVKEKYLSLPSEEDEPNLSPDQMNMLYLSPTTSSETMEPMDLEEQ